MEACKPGEQHFKKCFHIKTVPSQYRGPGSKQEIEFVNLVPMSLQAHPVEIQQWNPYTTHIDITSDFYYLIRPQAKWLLISSWIQFIMTWQKFFDLWDMRKLISHSALAARVIFIEDLRLWNHTTISKSYMFAVFVRLIFCKFGVFICSFWSKCYVRVFYLFAELYLVKSQLFKNWGFLRTRSPRAWRSADIVWTEVGGLLATWPRWTLISVTLKSRSYQKPGIILSCILLSRSWHSPTVFN
jgi:hypothetical protein